MREYEVVDENRDASTGELQSFLIIWENGEPEIKNATPENYLLFIEELYEFLNGSNAVILKEDDPEIIVAPTGEAYSYFISVDGSTVESTPSMSEDVLQGVMDVIEHGRYDKIKNVHWNIAKTQVRQSIINASYHTFDAEDKKRISRVSNGWLIDGFYLIDWNANLYAKDDDETETYERKGSNAVSSDKSYELVMLSQRGDVPDVQEMTVRGETYTFTEREMLFLAKVTWILHRTEYHPDIPFWLHVDSTNNAVPEDY